MELRWGGSFPVSESGVINYLIIWPTTFAEIRPSDTRTSLHDVQTIQVLRLVSSFDLRVSRRGIGFDITRRQPDHYHEDEERELCVEVRVSLPSQFFSCSSSFDVLIRGDRLFDLSERYTLMVK